jgi:hypothetical protein
MGQNTAADDQPHRMVEAPGLNKSVSSSMENKRSHPGVSLRPLRADTETRPVTSNQNAGAKQDSANPT